MAGWVGGWAWWVGGWGMWVCEGEGTAPGAGAGGQVRCADAWMCHVAKEQITRGQVMNSWIGWICGGRCKMLTWQGLAAGRTACTAASPSGTSTPTRSTPPSAFTGDMPPPPPTTHHACLPACLPACRAPSHPPTHAHPRHPSNPHASVCVRTHAAAAAVSPSTSGRSPSVSMWRAWCAWRVRRWQ